MGLWDFINPLNISQTIQQGISSVESAVKGLVNQGTPGPVGSIFGASSGTGSAGAKVGTAAYTQNIGMGAMDWIYWIIVLIIIVIIVWLLYRYLKKHRRK